MTSVSNPDSDLKLSSTKSGEYSIKIEEIERQSTVCSRLETGGYAKLAGHMARHPELAIFRRFAAIGTEALLCQHATLAALESRLRRVQEANRNSDNDACRLYDRSWDLLGKSAEMEEGEQRREQYDLLDKICELKFKYDEALFFHKQTISMRRPHQRLLSDLREWMSDSDRGNISIQSSDKKTWQPGEGMECDLLTFEDSLMDDFTRLVTYKLVDIFHKVTGGRLGCCLGKRKRTDQNNVLPVSQADICPTRIYSHRTIVACTRTLTILLACMLPVGSIILLYSVRDMVKRLGIMAGLTALFSICMALLTMATLADVFQATAAFAAVLVVFIGTTNGM